MLNCSFLRVSLIVLLVDVEKKSLINFASFKNIFAEKLEFDYKLI